MKLSRRTYADHFGPTTGDRVRLGRHRAHRPHRARLRHLRRRGEIRRRQGHPRRHGAVAVGDARRAARPISSSPRSLIIDSTGIYKADVGIRDGRISAIGKAGNPGIMDGVTPGLEIGASHRNSRGRRPHPHGRRHRLARPLHLAEPDSRRLSLGAHDAHRRRHRSGDRHQRDDLHAGRVEHPADVRSGRRRSR